MNVTRVEGGNRAHTAAHPVGRDQLSPLRQVHPDRLVLWPPAAHNALRRAAQLPRTKALLLRSTDRGKTAPPFRPVY